MRRYRILSWNVDVTQAREDVNRELDELCTKFNPRAIVLAEGYKVGPHYDRYAYFGPGHGVMYEVHTGAGVGSERYDVVLMSRGGFERKDTLALKSRWRGPKAGKMHDGRQLYGGVVSFAGKPVKLLGVHGPFGDRPVRQFVAAVRRWFVMSVPRRPVFVVGDLNMRPYRLRQLLRLIPGIHYAPNHGVDGVLVRNARIVACRTLEDAHGSDHRPQIIDIEF